MTTINGTGIYSPASIYGQNANRLGTAANANAGSASTTASTGSGAANSAKTVADAILAAANSAGLDFATVGQNARTVLDAGIAAYGQTPGSQTTDAQWGKIFGGMDRRSLYAVSSNQGGQFSPQEQKVAKTIMDTELANIGNVDSASSTSQQIAGYGQKVAFLNNVSAEEKKSASWAYSMADALTGARMADVNSRMPQVSGTSPLLSTLMGAMYNVRSQASGTVDFGTVNSLSDIIAQPWAGGYASQIEQAFAASYRPGGSFSVSI